MSERFTLRLDHGDRRLTLVGELDVAAAEQLTKAIDLLGEGGDPVTLDLSGLDFMDSTGLRAILTLAANLEGQAVVMLHNPTEQVREVLDVSGIVDRARNLFLSVEEGAPSDLPPMDSSPT